MPPHVDASRDLLFGLLALQTGLIEQGAMFTAFHAWTRSRGRPMADVLLEQGAIDAARRSLLDGLVREHLKLHGGDPDRSLASLAPGTSTVQGLVEAAGPDLRDTLAHLGPDPTESGGDQHDRTVDYVLGTSASEGHRFRVLRPHARGGLGAVFVALDSELNREVALKRILDRHADDPVSRQRFQLEAEITGGLEHPGIVPVYGLGTYDDGRPYYAMRFVRGDNLKDAIGRFHADATLARDPGRRSLELRKLLRRFLDVCNAIDYAHGRGVLHRDIKPGNIIVGKHGETLVVDWGLAKPIGRVEADSGPAGEEPTLVPSSSSGVAETLPGSAVGTPAYMSPEQAAGDFERLGPRSDVYSLGATLYCLLTGKPPVDLEDAGAALAAVRRGEFPRPREVEPSVDRALEAVCLKAMALRPDDRYATPRELADDLDRWLADEPVTAWRESYPRRAGRLARRHLAAVTALGATALMTLVGLSAVVASEGRANRALAARNALLVEANRREAAALADLKGANAAAEARFALAMEAVRTFHTGVANDVLLKQKEFADLRGRLLRGALDFYRKLERRLQFQGDRASRRALSEATYEVATLTGLVGTRTEALEASRQALAVRRRLLAETPDSPAARADVAKSLIAVGDLDDATGRRAEATAAFDEARALLESAPAPSASDPAVRRTLAESYQEIGRLRLAEGRTADARASFERARGVFEEILRVDPGDARSRYGLARCCIDIGTVSAGAGRSSEALAAFGRARELNQELSKADPTFTGYRNDLAIAWSRIGNLQANLGRREEAEASLARAAGILQEMVDRVPTIVRHTADLAATLNDLGNVQRGSGHADRARDSFVRSRDLFESLLGADPSNNLIRENLARCTSNLGLAEQILGNLGRASVALERGRELLEAAAGADPDNVRVRDGLAVNLNLLGMVESARGDPDHALAAFARARAIQSDRVRATPDAPEPASSLGATLNNMATIHMRRGQWVEAHALLVEAVRHQRTALRASPRNPTFRQFLRNHLVNLATVALRRGDPSEAASASSELISLSRGQPGLLYDAACNLALAARLEGDRLRSALLAKASLDALEQAVAAGWTDANHTAQDPDLLALRDRDDFRRLLLRVLDRSFPAEPFAR